MAPLESLPPDQRAVLQLVLQRGRSYDEIAAMLSIDRAAVRDRALSAFDTIGPPTRVTSERRALITDYLMGQLPPRVAEQIFERLKSAPAERAWARALASDLSTLSRGPLPDIPSSVESTPPASTRPAPTPPPAAAPTPPPAPSDRARELGGVAHGSAGAAKPGGPEPDSEAAEPHEARRDRRRTHCHAAPATQQARRRTGPAVGRDARFGRRGRSDERLAAAAMTPAPRSAERAPRRRDPDRHRCAGRARRDRGRDHPHQQRRLEQVVRDGRSDAAGDW